MDVSLGDPGSPNIRPLCTTPNMEELPIMGHDHRPIVGLANQERADAKGRDHRPLHGILTHKIKHLSSTSSGRLQPVSRTWKKRARISSTSVIVAKSILSKSRSQAIVFLDNQSPRKKLKLKDEKFLEEPGTSFMAAIHQPR